MKYDCPMRKTNDKIHYVCPHLKTLRKRKVCKLSEKVDRVFKSGWTETITFQDCPLATAVEKLKIAKRDEKQQKLF